eukprot:XP_764793.1 hypothetical protein [Theileria parva strain Muguga]
MQTLLWLSDSSQDWFLFIMLTLMVILIKGYIFSGDSEGTVICCKLIDEKLLPIWYKIYN